MKHHLLSTVVSFALLVAACALTWAQDGPCDDSGPAGGGHPAEVDPAPVRPTPSDSLPDTQDRFGAPGGPFDGAVDPFGPPPATSGGDDFSGGGLLPGEEPPPPPPATVPNPYLSRPFEPKNS